MFCTKCGHPLNESDEICSNCGAPVEKTPVEDDQTVTPDAQQETVAKKKGKLPVWIAIGAVAIIAVIALILNFGSISNWFMRVAGSPEDMLAVAYKTSLAQALEPMMASYQETLTKAQTETPAGSGQIALKPGQQILEMMAYSIYGGEGDVSWLSDIRLGVDYAVDGQLQKNSLALALGENELLAVELINDNENHKMYIAAPALHEQALVTDMGEAAEISSMDMSELYSAMPSKEVLVRVLERYLDIQLKGFNSVEKKQETLTLGSISQNVTALEAYMDEAGVIDVMTATLEQLKQDEDVKKILMDMASVYEGMNLQAMDPYMEEVDAEEVYAEFIDTIDASLAQLKEERLDADPENQLCLCTYVDNSNIIVGLKLSMTGMEDPLSCLSLTKDGQFISNFYLEGLQIDGSGTAENSTYVVSMDEEKLLDVKLENMTQTSGVIYLEPSASLLAAIAEESEMDASMASMADIVLRIELESASDHGEFSIDLLSNEVSLFTIEISGGMAEAQKVALPTGAASMDNEDELLGWLMELDMEGLMTQLTEAGVPEEVLTALLMGLIGA